MGKTPTQIRRLGVYNLVFEFFFLNIFVGFFFGFTRLTTSQVNLIGLTSLFRLTAFLVMGFFRTDQGPGSTCRVGSDNYG
jgi:hypothetical protein